MIRIKWWICTSLITVFSIAGVSAQHYTLWEDFKKPPVNYRPIPFWHLNGKLTTQEINRQVTDAAKSGFGGVAVLPVTAGKQHPTGLPSPGMSPEYLTEDYFTRYGDILKAAKTEGLQVLLYDDVDFPSGNAGGKLQEMYPEATRKVLTKTDTTVLGPAQFVMSLPRGINMATVAQNNATSALMNLSRKVQNGKLTWDVPAGKWKIMFFSCTPNADRLVDFMDTTAVRKFMGLTYDQYAGRFSPYFGNVIQQTFYDDVGYVTMERAWTLSFNQKFRKLYQRDPDLYYPALWENIGPQTEAARVALFNTRAELLAEGFPKLIAEWADKHGIKSSGHPPGNYEVQPVDMNFDIFKFYRYNHIPTMDAIFYQGHGRPGYKLVSSAATAYDRPIVAAEVYGAFAEDKFNLKMMYRTAMEIFVRGINSIIPHGMWYDPKPQSVRIPPLISAYSEKVGAGLKDFNDYAARTSVMLQGGRSVADIAVIYPISSLEGFYHFEAKENKGWGKFAPAETDYMILSDLLTNQVHRDFTFIHPELFSGPQYEIQTNQLLLKNKQYPQAYSLVILPAGRVISYSALKKLKQFYDQGGKVIATGLLPSKSAEFGKDSGVCKIITELFGIDPNQPETKIAEMRTSRKGGKAVFIRKLDRNTLTEALNQMNVSVDVRFENSIHPDSGNGALSYLHKIVNNQNIYFFANSTDQDINTVIDLRGKIDPELWDPYTGEKSVPENITHVKIDGTEYTRMSLSLPHVKSVFVVEKR
nr:glycosyl hydrolase [Pedobacter panaciterrae]